MIGNIPLLAGYLIAMINIVLFLLVFFMLIEVIRNLKLFEMPAAMIIAACAAFVFIIGFPLLSAMEQLLKEPHRNICEMILKSVVEMFPVQMVLIITEMCIWAIIKGTSPEDTK